LRSSASRATPSGVAARFCSLVLEWPTVL
jgi:hypothetical protein